MTNSMRIICLMIGYSFGLIQSAYIYGRLHNIDIREHGSQNAGATNALRVLGKKAGAIVFALDVTKAVVAILLVRMLFSYGHSAIFPILVLYTGLGTVLGHNYPVYLKFRGGKGIAVMMGVMVSLSLMHLMAIFVFLLCLVLTRYVSLSSLLMVLVFFMQAIWYSLSPAGVYTVQGFSARIEFLILALILTALPFLTHRKNIARLRDGTERKIGEKERVQKG